MIDACENVDYVIHTASPVQTKLSEQKQIDAAVGGVEGILKGCV